MGTQVKKLQKDIEKIMHILNIDSTSRRLSVTLSSDEKIISSVSRESDRRFMEMIMGDIGRALKKAKIGIYEVDILGVNRGPGDFTGTRIGISVVKTLGWVLDKPVYGINALDILAHTMADKYSSLHKNVNDYDRGIIIVPCLDVRKNELYFSLYKVMPGGKAEKGIEAIASISKKDQQYVIYDVGNHILTEADDFQQELRNSLENIKGGKEKTLVIGGNVIERYGDMLSELESGSESIIIDRESIFTDPSSLDTCVRQAINNNKPPQRVDPVYAREFVPFSR